MSQDGNNLFGQLVAVNRSLFAIVQASVELLLSSSFESDDSSAVSAAALREIAADLIAVGGDLTKLGVNLASRIADRSDQG